MSKAKAVQAVEGTLVYKQFIALADGTEVQVRYNQDPSLYADTDVKLYSYIAKEGRGKDAKEVTRYAVAVEDARRANRSSSKATIEKMLADGMSAEEVLAKMLGK